MAGTTSTWKYADFDSYFTKISHSIESCASACKDETTLNGKKTMGFAYKHSDGSCKCESQASHPHPDCTPDTNKDWARYDFVNYSPVFEYKHDGRCQDGAVQPSTQTTTLLTGSTDLEKATECSRVCMGALINGEAAKGFVVGGDSGTQCFCESDSSGDSSECADKVGADGTWKRYDFVREGVYETKGYCNPTGGNTAGFNSAQTAPENTWVDNCKVKCLAESAGFTHFSFVKSDGRCWCMQTSSGVHTEHPCETGGKVFFGTSYTIWNGAAIPDVPGCDHTGVDVRGMGVCISPDAGDEDAGSDDTGDEDAGSDNTGDEDSDCAIGEICTNIWGRMIVGSGYGAAFSNPSGTMMNPKRVADNIYVIGELDGSRFKMVTFDHGFNLIKSKYSDTVDSLDALTVADYNNAIDKQGHPCSGFDDFCAGEFSHGSCPAPLSDDCISAPYTCTPNEDMPPIKGFKHMGRGECPSNYGNGITYTAIKVHNGGSGSSPNFSAYKNGKNFATSTPWIEHHEVTHWCYDVCNEASTTGFIVRTNGGADDEFYGKCYCEGGHYPSCLTDYSTGVTSDQSDSYYERYDFVKDTVPTTNKLCVSSPRILCEDCKYDEVCAVGATTYTLTMRDQYGDGWDSVVNDVIDSKNVYDDRDPNADKGFLYIDYGEGLIGFTVKRQDTRSPVVVTFTGVITNMFMYFSSYAKEVSWNLACGGETKQYGTTNTNLNVFQGGSTGGDSGSNCSTIPCSGGEDFLTNIPCGGGTCTSSTCAAGHIYHNDLCILSCDSGQEPVNDSCTDCGAGKYSSDGVVCEDCQDGMYQDQSGMASCKVCGANEEPISNKQDCQCEGGYGGSPCTACNPGQYSLDGACTACTDGYQNEAGQTSCKTCGANEEANADGTACQCTDGYVSQPIEPYRGKCTNMWEWEYDQPSIVNGMPNLESIQISLQECYDKMRVRGHTYLAHDHMNTCFTGDECTSQELDDGTLTYHFPSPTDDLDSTTCVSCGTNEEANADGTACQCIDGYSGSPCTLCPLNDHKYDWDSGCPAWSDNDGCSCICTGSGFSGDHCDICAKGMGWNGVLGADAKCTACDFPTVNDQTSHNAVCSHDFCPPGKGTTSDQNVWRPDNSTTDNCENCTENRVSPDNYGQCTEVICDDYMTVKDTIDHTLNNTNQTNCEPCSEYNVGPSCLPIVCTSGRMKIPHDGSGDGERYIDYGLEPNNQDNCVTCGADEVVSTDRMTCEKIVCPAGFKILVVDPTLSYNDQTNCEECAGITYAQGTECIDFDCGSNRVKEVFDRTEEASKCGEQCAGDTILDVNDLTQCVACEGDTVVNSDHTECVTSVCRVGYTVSVTDRSLAPKDGYHQAANCDEIDDCLTASCSPCGDVVNGYVCTEEIELRQGIESFANANEHVCPSGFRLSSEVPDNAADIGLRNGACPPLKVFAEKLSIHEGVFRSKLVGGTASVVVEGKACKYTYEDLISGTYEV